MMGAAGILGMIAVAVVGLATGGHYEESTSSSGSGSGSGSSSTPQAGAIKWHDGRGGTLSNSQRKENYDAVYLMGKALEDAGLFGPGFADWMRIVAYTEARGNPSAGSDAFSNAARGMFGLRPTTGWNESATVDGKDRQWDEEDAELAFRNGEVTGAEVEALKDLTWAVALSAHNVSRLRKYLNGESYTLEGARRGWAYPSLVPDVDNSERPELLDRWHEALAFFGYPADFGKQPMRVLVSRDQFPHPHAVRNILIDAIAGGDPTTQDQEGFVKGSIESGSTAGSGDKVYSWALGELLEGGWSWAVTLWIGDADEPSDKQSGDTTTRGESAVAIGEAVDLWEE